MVLRLILGVWMVVASAALSAPVSGSFPSADGGELSLDQWRGQPILVVNTASRCAYTKQYDALQALYDRYRARGLVVLAVPSDDFNQELADIEAVKEFCTLNFALDLPMTEIIRVRGPLAHPVYKAIRNQSGFEPRWNFNKVLIGPNGEVVRSWGATEKPLSKRITQEIEAVLN